MNDRTTGWLRFRRILEMIRFSHTVFALPFALMAAVMAWTVPTRQGGHVVFHWWGLLGVLICMVCARSAAMAFNRLVDRDLDRENPRTRERHLPAGTVSLASVIWFTVLASLGFVAGTLLFLPNQLPLWLSLPVLAFLMAYSYTKRFTALAHFWLGFALMLAPISTWIALRGEVVLQDVSDLWPAGLLGLAVLLWVAGFDMIYACQDVAFDVNAHLHSLPVRFGIAGALRLAAVCHLAMIGVLACLPMVGYFGGPPLRLGWIYGSSLVGAALLLAYEHAIVKPDDLSRVNIAFFNTNAIISIGLLIVITLDLLT